MDVGVDQARDHRQTATVTYGRSGGRVRSGTNERDPLSIDAYARIVQVVVSDPVPETHVRHAPGCHTRPP